MEARSSGRQRSCRDLAGGALLQALGSGRRRSSGRQPTPAGAREGWRRCSGWQPTLASARAGAAVLLRSAQALTVAVECVALRRG
jgi:hypothetical protein